RANPVVTNLAQSVIRPASSKKTDPPGRPNRVTIQTEADMRSSLGIGLAAWAVVTAAFAADRPFDPPSAKCSGHGTSVQFYDTPKDAAAHAKAEQKLVLVLHVSGLFEDPSLT